MLFKYLWYDCTFIWPNLGFAGSCEYLLNKSAQKPWNFLLFKKSEWRMNTQDGSGLWGHHDNAKSPLPYVFRNQYISKKVDAKNYLIKYVVENTRLKKIIPNLYRQLTFYWDTAARRDLNLYRKSMERVIVVYTLEAVNFGAQRDRGILFLHSKWTCTKADENPVGVFWSELRNREFWVNFNWVECFDCSLGKFEIYKLLWKLLFWIPDTLGNMIFNIILKLK